MSTAAAQARRAVAGAMICQMGLGLGGYVFGAFLKPIVAELGWSRAAFSVSTLPFLLAMALASPVVGAATDRFGPRRIFAGGIVVVASALVGLSCMRTLGEFYAFGFVLGMGATALGDIPAGTVVTRFVGVHAGMALGFVYIGSNIGGALVPLVATAVTGLASWRVALRVLAAIGLLVVLPAALWLVPGGTGTREETRIVDARGSGLTLAAARRTAPFAVLAAVLFLFYAYYLAVNTHLVAYLSDVGFGDASAARSFGYTVAIGIAGKLATGLVADRIGLRTAMLGTFGALALASWLLLAVGAVPWLRPVFLTLHGLTVAAENVLLPLIVVATFGARHMPAIYGALMLALLPGGVVGPLVAGHAFDTLGSYRPAFALFATTNVLIVAALAWLTARARIVEA
ncbi:MAG TPA: MFS transporter [Candidatus Limnocylindria bacterium]|nr:MFS transporter [Candidatus Limnocylindria bacterium]